MIQTRTFILALLLSGFATQSIAQAEHCSMAQGVFMHGDRASNDIALTFDACPTSHIPPFDDRIADFLKKEKVPTTIFVSGAWAKDNPQDLKKLTDVPFFEIGLHGNTHPRLIDATEEKVRDELESGRTILETLGVKPVPFFRPPFWDHPDSLPRACADSHTIALIGDVALGDPSPTRTATAMQRDAFQWVQGGSIIVLHINGRGVHTAETIEKLVPALRKRGYRFVKVSQLAQECGYYSPEKGLLRQLNGTWDWGSTYRSAQVPFIRIQQGNAGWVVKVKDAIHHTFQNQAQDVQYDGNTLRFTYLYQPLKRQAQCALKWNGQLLEGHCDGETAAGQWGKLAVHLWPGEPDSISATGL